jgi:alcohol dehydrogenase
MTPMLLKTVVSGKLQPNQLITHHFILEEVMKVGKKSGPSLSDQMS